jgi:hypothetical protein
MKERVKAKLLSPLAQVPISFLRAHQSEAVSKCSAVPQTDLAGRSATVASPAIPASERGNQGERVGASFSMVFSLLPVSSHDARPFHMWHLVEAGSRR